MSEFRPVVFFTGALLVGLSVAMLLPASADAARGNADWVAFVKGSAATLFFGGALMLAARGGPMRLSLRQAFLLTVVSWLAAAAFAALPLHFSRLGLGYTNAFFESMSGITSTGATILPSVDRAPAGVLLWRAMLNWAGGLAFVVLSSAVLPMLHVGGMQVFRTEGLDVPEKLLPRAAQLATATGGIYLVLTAFTAVALWAAGMPSFDAAVHAMTSISTGGFSTRDAQLQAFDGALIPWIVVLAMIAGSLPFALYVEAMRGNVHRLVLDAQVRGFFAILGVFVLLAFLWLWQAHGAGLGRALEQSIFAVVSIMSGTGFTDGALGQWGGFPVVLLFLLMFVGGCAGSTACGIKIFRFQIAYSVGRAQLAKLVQPHGVFVPHYNRQPVTDEVATAVMGFFFLFVATFVGLALGLAALGLDLVSALSGAATIVGNVGPGFGPLIGPSGNFASLPEAAKWLAAAGMLIGRLEVFTIFVLFSAAFWRS
jgi:trk system potassium uptake protein TrkH